MFVPSALAGVLSGDVSVWMLYSFLTGTCWHMFSLLLCSRNTLVTGSRGCGIHKWELIASSCGVLTLLSYSSSSSLISTTMTIIYQKY